MSRGEKASTCIGGRNALVSKKGEAHKHNGKEQRERHHNV